MTMAIRLTTKQAFLWLVGIDAALAALYGVAYWRLGVLNDGVRELTAQVSGYAATDASLSSLQANLNETKAEVAKIDGYYISQDGVVQFVGLVESLARQNGLKIEVQSLEAQEDKSTKAFQEKVALRLQTTGSWANTRKYVELVENLPYRVVIESMSAEREEQAPPSWKTNLVITALKLK